MLNNDNLKLNQVNMQEEHNSGLKVMNDKDNSDLNKKR